MFALIGSACYAVDSGNGAIRWKRTVGENLPFAPIAVTNNVLCVLFYDARQEEMVLCNSATANSSGGFFAKKTDPGKSAGA